MTTATQVAEYKGRKYRLAWQGQTKYGERAKLQFFDGSKEFWVAADAISVSQGYSSYGSSFAARGRRGRRECQECGEIIRSPDQNCWETGGTCFA